MQAFFSSPGSITLAIIGAFVLYMALRAAVSPSYRAHLRLTYQRLRYRTPPEPQKPSWLDTRNRLVDELEALRVYVGRQLAMSEDDAAWCRANVAIGFCDVGSHTPTEELFRGVDGLIAETRALIENRVLWLKNAAVVVEQWPAERATRITQYTAMEARHAAIETHVAPDIASVLQGYLGRATHSVDSIDAAVHELANAVQRQKCAFALQLVKDIEEHKERFRTSYEASQHLDIACAVLRDACLRGGDTERTRVFLGHVTPADSRVCQSFLDDAFALTVHQHPNDDDAEVSLAVARVAHCMLHAYAAGHELHPSVQRLLAEARTALTHAICDTKPSYRIPQCAIVVAHVHAARDHINGTVHHVQPSAQSEGTLVTEV